jgi:hypothetical protein
MLIVPVYVPGCRLAPLTLTAMVPGVVPLAGVTESQLLVVVTVVNAENERATPELPTVTICAAGASPPAACVKLKVAGETVKFPDVIVKVTGIVTSGFPFVECTNRLPWYVPGAKPNGLTATIKLLGVALDAGPLVAPTTSQLAFGGVVVEAVTE